MLSVPLDKENLFGGAEGILYSEALASNGNSSLAATLTRGSNMISIKVHGRNGVERTIFTRPGSSLMEALRDNGFDEILAICGGCCSCATCHVYIEQGPEGAGEVGNADENDLLDSSEHRQPNSRLACQVHLDNATKKLSVRIAPED